MKPKTCTASARNRPFAWIVGCAALTLALAGCGDKRVVDEGPIAAKVGNDSVSVARIDFVLQQQRGLRPDQLDAARGQILERLIDQQLEARKAEEGKLERDPRVALALDEARREVLARAYTEKVGEAAPKPTAEEVKKYYDGKPALFAERRIYSLQELVVEARPEQFEALRAKLAEAKNIGEFVAYLNANGLHFVANQAVRAAEQLPLASLDQFARMKDGQAVVTPTPTGLQIIVLVGSRMQPVTEEQARPAIEQFILGERRRKLVDDDLKALRAAAKIEYVGKYADKPAAATAGAAPASAASSAGTKP